MSEAAPMPWRSRLMIAGLALTIVVSPLVITPVTAYPFLDPKLLTLVAGATAIALARPLVDRSLYLLALAFVTVVLIATLLGVDPAWSLLGSEWRGVGLLAYACSALLLCAATGLSEDLRARVPEWLFWTGAAVAAVGTLGRFVDIGGSGWELGRLSSTLGHRVFVGGFLATALIAATSVRRTPAFYAGLVVIATGLALSAARSGWLAAAFGLGTVLWRRRNWRSARLVLVPIVFVLAGWTVASPYLPKGWSQYSAVPRFLQLHVGTGLERFQGWRAYARAWARDPVLGSGPETTWGDYLGNASPDEIRTAERGFGDPHNLFLEMGTTTGLAGVLASVALGSVVLRRALRASPDRAWALGALGAIAIVHSVEPSNLVLTPLMFFTAGLAADDASAGRRRKIGRWVALPLAIGLALASIDFVASSFEAYARRTSSESAYRTTTRLAPWRLAAALQLAILRAGRARMGDEQARAEAYSLVKRSVSWHGWYPEARTLATEALVQMDDRVGAEQLIDDQLRIFPNDPVALGRKAALLLARGARREALRYASKALRIDPTLTFVRDIARASTR